MAELHRISYIEHFGRQLLSIEKPARYLGGELGQIIKPNADYTIALCFPDMYEIGMSNQAIRILYDKLNQIEGVRCERVFAPNLDFEKLLLDTDTALCTLETGIPLHECDMIGFSIGYELSASNILTILNTGKVPILKKDRNATHPLVIAGGPAITNPAPFDIFFDAAYIGEAEEDFFTIVKELYDLKKAQKNRGEMLSHVLSYKSMWTQNKKAYKATFSKFDSELYSTVFPIANIKPIQDHGTIEIMRGCPNGCRFCHAGYFYRPQRMKNSDLIMKEAENLILKGGYRELTLSSLSTGDYEGIDTLIQKLNSYWKDYHVSIQLPSLKVSSFTLPLLESVSEVRKSGLTFAIETPISDWQKSINKDVERSQVIEILHTAKTRGWKLAKFYFMIGLPVTEDVIGEAKAIVDFLIGIQRQSKMQLNANIGVFVPKPHTPYQYDVQLSEEKAKEAYDIIWRGLKGLPIKVSRHNAFVARLEGIIARGTNEVGNLLYDAYCNGARLDAWDEHFKADVWRNLIEGETYKELCDKISSGSFTDEDAPWKDINIGISKAYLSKERNKSTNHELSSICNEDCNSPCGACNDNQKLVKKELVFSERKFVPKTFIPVNPDVRLRMIFTFTKTSKAMYLSHLNLVELFTKAFLRAQFPIMYTEGFNPGPRLEFASPISLGTEGKEELAQVYLTHLVSEEEFIHDLNLQLPDGLRVTSAKQVFWPLSKKAISLSSMFLGSTWKISLVNSHKDNFSLLASRLTQFLKENSVGSINSQSDSELVFDLLDIQKKEFQISGVLQTVCAEICSLQDIILSREKLFSGFDESQKATYYDYFDTLLK